MDNFTPYAQSAATNFREILFKLLWQTDVSVKMKILITTPTFPPAQNGVAHVAFAHAVGLTRKGYQVSIATGYNALRTEEPCFPGIEVYQYRVSGQGSLHSPHKGAINEYRQFVSDFGGDLVISHCWEIWTTNLAIQAIPMTAKSLLVSHGFSANVSVRNLRSLVRRFSFSLYLLNMRDMMRRFDWITFLTNRADKWRFYDRLAAGRMGLTNFSIIPNGVDLVSHDQSRTTFRQRFAIETSHLVLNVSNYYREKNQQDALRAFALSGMTNATLVFIGGKETEYLSYLENLYTQLKSKHKMGSVLFLSGLSRNDIFDAYRAADIFVFTSITEAQPLVILDAMASATPFISTRVGCLEDFPGGVVVSSLQDMADELKRLLNDLTLRHRLGEQGRSACIEKYNWNAVIEQFDELLKQLVVHKS
jgi:glycosyltransferase involved in cell wall biosynthesis